MLCLIIFFYFLIFVFLMIRRPPISTRTDTLFPYTTLCRSIQSFEVDNLKALHALTPVRLIQLLDKEGGPADGAVASYAAMTTPAGLKAVAADRKSTRLNSSH